MGDLFSFQLCSTILVLIEIFLQLVLSFNDNDFVSPPSFSFSPQDSSSWSSNYPPYFHFLAPLVPFLFRTNKFISSQFSSKIPKMLMKILNPSNTFLLRLPSSRVQFLLLLFKKLDFLQACLHSWSTMECSNDFWEVWYQLIGIGPEHHKNKKTIKKKMNIIDSA